MAKLTKEQVDAICNVTNAYYEAMNNRHWQDRFDNEISAAPNYQNFHEPAIRAQNAEECNASYKKLHEALNHDAVKGHLDSEIIELKDQLGEAFKTSDFSQVEKTLDRSFAQHRRGGPAIEFVKVGEIEKNNPKLSIADRLSDFGKKVVAAIASLGSNRDIGE